MSKKVLYKSKKQNKTNKHAQNKNLNLDRKLCGPPTRNCYYRSLSLSLSLLIIITIIIIILIIITVIIIITIIIIINTIIILPLIIIIKSPLLKFTYFLLHHHHRHLHLREERKIHV